MSADLQDTRADGKPLPIITCDAKLADQAYVLYSAMRRAEIETPDLLKIPLWNAFKASAYCWFERAFELV
jgi:hypothetical protein